MEYLGISTRAYQYYESGERYPDFEGLLALADYFQVSIDYLVGRSDEPWETIEDEQHASNGNWRRSGRQ